MPLANQSAVLTEVGLEATRPLVIKQGRFVAIVAEFQGPWLATATAMALMIDLISLGSDAPIAAIVVMVSQLLELLLMVALPMTLSFNDC